MLRSMFSGVSGLRSHQTFMDVIGNNISNVNTTGYKGSQMIFSDLLSQLMQAASAGGSQGGTNPAAIGLGVTVGGIRGSFTQGASQLTGRSTDLSIQGDGFFAVRKGTSQENLFTRAGSLSFDPAGRLSTPDGGVIQGWMADANGTVDSNKATTDLQIPLGQIQPPKTTSTTTVGGNLPADAPNSPATGSQITSTITIYDQQGTGYSLSYRFTKTAANTWTLDCRNENTSTTGGSATITFDNTTGEINTITAGANMTYAGGVLTLSQAGLQTAFPAPASWAAAGVTVSLGQATTSPDRLRSFSGSSSMAALSQDGSAVGFLRSFQISKDGTITGTFSNGATRTLAKISLSLFANPAGLEKIGESLYRKTVNSGEPQYRVPGQAGGGDLSAGTLEMSNVELAQEFTNLVIAQRGFQANSRIVSASDTLLQDLVNMAR